MGIKVMSTESGRAVLGKERSTCHGTEEPHKAAVRASIVALKWVKTVEQRDAGRWKGEEDR